MKAIFHKKIQKFISKIKDKILLSKIKQVIDGVISNAISGKLLEQPFRKYNVYVVSIIYKSNEYRIAYFFDSKNNEIVFLLINSRENFYKKLKNILE